MQQFEVLRADGFFRHKRSADELPHVVPEFRAHRHHREALELLALNQRQRLKRLIQRAQTARHDDERARVLHKHDLPHKKWSISMNRSRYGFALCSMGRMMLHPRLTPPASFAPRLAASIMPGPPPVITA